MDHFDTWVAWINEPIYLDVVTMIHSRQVWHGYGEIVNTAADMARADATFHDWLKQNYLSAQASAIRRQTDKRTDVISLRRLMREISDDPESLSRDRYLAASPNLEPTDAAAYFDREWSQGGSHVAADVVRGDIDRLTKQTERVVVWAHKEIAHYDPKKGFFSQGLKIGDVHQAIDAIASMMNRYRMLLKASTVHLEVAMSAGWDRVFGVAWARH